MEWQLRKLRKIFRRITRLFRRVRFCLLFPRIPDTAVFANSKLIAVLKSPGKESTPRDYLAFVRCGTDHRLIDDGRDRNFDIALNAFAGQADDQRQGYEYLIAGGLNKYKAACQFLDRELLDRYLGFIFLDDDLEISYSDLSAFLRYCTTHNLALAQPSLTLDSHFSHRHLLNAAATGCRPVDLIEVMCPYFSADALKTTLHTFDLSYSTWGLDYLWPRLIDTAPVVVDEFRIKHTRPIGRDGEFYKYMTTIGVSPERESERLKKMPLEAIRKQRMSCL